MSQTKTFTIYNPEGLLECELSINPSGISITSDVGEIELSDEYHTIHELYEHRMALTVALANTLQTREDGWTPIEVVKSKLHNDGTMFEGGYFIVVFKTPEGQISYHYKLEHWDRFSIPEVERVPWEYDGHSSKDTIDRLLIMGQS